MVFFKNNVLMIFYLVILIVYNDFLLSMEHCDKKERSEIEVTEPLASGKKIVVQIGQEKFELSSHMVKEIEVLNMVIEDGEELDANEEEISNENEIEPIEINELFPDKDAYTENSANFEKIIMLLQSSGLIEKIVSQYSIAELISLIICVNKLNVPKIFIPLIEFFSDYIQHQEKINDELLIHLQKLQQSNDDVFYAIVSKIKYVVPILEGSISIGKDEKIENICFNKTATKVVFNTSDRLYIVDWINKKICNEIIGEFCYLQFMCDDRLLALERVAPSKRIRIWELSEDDSAKIVLNEYVGEDTITIGLSPDNKILKVQHSSGNLSDLKLIQLNKDECFRSESVSFLSHTGCAEKMAVSPDGNFIAMNGNSFIYLWNFKDLNKSETTDPQVIFDVRSRGASREIRHVKNLFFDDEETKTSLLYIIQSRMPDRDTNKDVVVSVANCEEKFSESIPAFVDRRDSYQYEYWKWKDSCVRAAKAVKSWSMCQNDSPEQSNNSLQDFDKSDQRNRQSIIYRLLRSIAQLGAMAQIDDEHCSVGFSKNKKYFVLGAPGRLIVWKLWGANLDVAVDLGELPLMHALSRAYHKGEKLHLCDYSNPDLYQIYRDINSKDLSYFVDCKCSVENCCRYLLTKKESDSIGS